MILALKAKAEAEAVLARLGSIARPRLVATVVLRGGGRAVHGAQRYALEFARNWWRPASCWAIFGSIAVSGVYLPLHNKTGADLTALSALVAALTPFIAARSFEKVKGASGSDGSSDV